MTDIQRLTQRLVDFCEARNWKQFHTPKDCAISLALEAAEVLEHFQWKNSEEIQEHLKVHKDDVAEELADVLYWVLLMSYYFEIDIAKSLNEKMEKNEKKYPVNQSKNRHSKYTELRK